MRLPSDQKPRPLIDDMKSEKVLIGVPLADKCSRPRLLEIVGEKPEHAHRSCLGSSYALGKMIPGQALVKRACDHTTGTLALEVELMERVIELGAMRVY